MAVFGLKELQQMYCSRQILWHDRVPLSILSISQSRDVIVSPSFFPGSNGWTNIGRDKSCRCRFYHLLIFSKVTIDLEVSYKER